MDGPHIKAHLSLLPTESGGRRTPVFSGYRPQFRYLGRDNDVRIDLLKRESLRPGDTGEVNLTFFRPELQLSRIVIGTKFELAEGAKPVALGTIIEVLKPELIACHGSLQSSPSLRESTLAKLQLAIESKCDPESVFSRIICLGWYDGPLSGLLTCDDRDYRFDLVDDADVLQFRVFQLSPLPIGSVSRFVATMREYGLLKPDESPRLPMWVPMWKFPTASNQQAAEQFTDNLLTTSSNPVAAFCWNFAESRIIACRGIDDPESRPGDWFDWLGIQRVGERIDP